MLKGTAKIPELKREVMTKRHLIVSKFGSNIQMIVVEVGSEQGETCKGIIMSFVMYGREFWNVLSKEQYSILDKRLVW